MVIERPGRPAFVVASSDASSDRTGTPRGDGAHYAFALSFLCIPLPHHSTCLRRGTYHRHFGYPRRTTVMTSKKDKVDEKRARNFIESFKTLSLTGDKKPEANFTPAPRANFAEASAPRYSYPGGFVGGSPQPHHLPSPPPPWPPHHAAMIPPPPVLYDRMPLPQHTSLTMQHAIAGSLLPDTPPMPPPFPAQGPGAGPSNSIDAGSLGPRPNSDPPPFVPPHVGLRTPQPLKVKPPQTHRRTQSEPPSPTSTHGNGEKRQCSGMTTAGKRCRNQVRPSGAQAHTDSDVFCRVHANKMGEPSGFYDRKSGQTFIKFSGGCMDQPARHVFAAPADNMIVYRLDSGVFTASYTNGTPCRDAKGACSERRGRIYLRF